MPASVHKVILSAVTSPAGKRPHVSVELAPALEPLTALLDTGAGPNCIRRDVFQLCKPLGLVLCKIEHHNLSIYNASGKRMLGCSLNTAHSRIKL